MNKKYKKTYLSLLTHFEKETKNKKKAYCIHVPHIGKNYNNSREILLIGRALNGTEETNAKFIPESHNSKNVLEYNNKTQSTDWLKDYNKSSFFRICKKYLLKKGYSELDWFDNIIWSNLMKISPAKKGNPTDKEWEIQKEGCIELFKQEIILYSPKLILMLTDYEWAYDFIESLGINPEKTAITSRYKYIKGKYHYNNSTILIYERPERKNENNFVNSILKMYKQ